MSAEWMTAPRWSQSHLIVESPKDWHNGAYYARTACGRSVNSHRLNEEPTGIDTLDRCPICRRHAAEHGAEESP